MSPIATGAVHHIALTVSDVPRSVKFYSTLLGFQPVAELPPKVLMSNGTIILGVGTSPDPAKAQPSDSFTENRIGLDHVSINVGSRRELEEAVKLFDQNNVSHGEIKELTPFGIAVLAFRDPDNIQVELTSPLT